MSEETPQVAPTQEARVEACCAEIAATLKRFRCRLVAKIQQAESVGDGAKILVSAECRVIPTE